MQLKKMDFSTRVIVHFKISVSGIKVDIFPIFKKLLTIRIKLKWDICQNRPVEHKRMI